MGDATRRMMRDRTPTERLDLGLQLLEARVEAAERAVDPDRELEPEERARRVFHHLRREA